MDSSSMRFLYFLCFMGLLAWGCSTPPSNISSWHEDNGKIKVLSTTAMIDDLVREIGGERVDHITLITGQIDPHSYELVKGDDEKILCADLVIANGLNLEHGASLHNQLSKHSNVVFLSEAIKKIRPHKVIYTGKEIDPHLWMDISLWAEGVDVIVQKLSSLDPEGAAYFETNGSDLHGKMLSVHSQIVEMFKEVPEEKRYLVTSHDAFHYFTRAYLTEEGAQGDSWENRCVAPEGLAPEGQLSSRDIQRVMDHLCLYKVGVVFPESNVGLGPLKKITASCKQIGVDVRISDVRLYGDAMGAPGSGADEYLGMMLHNAKVLKEEWTK